jgi:hypothetical protein
MDHHYIDRNAVAERYLQHVLAPEERAAFETHLVDCTECTDRLLLAEMFHARNGAAPTPSAPKAAHLEDPLPLRVRFVALLRPWQLLTILVLAAMILVVLPAVLFYCFIRP